MVLALVATFGPAWAGPLEDGIAAHGRGDCAKALSLHRPLAVQGESGAQFHLSLIYGNGQGVPIDGKESIKWLRLSANQGNGIGTVQLGLRVQPHRRFERNTQNTVKSTSVRAVDVVNRP